MGRLILHHGLDPHSVGTAIDERVVRGCWFEWHRQGGCGPGELKLERTWAETADVQPGDWISIGVSADERWYLGRVDQWQAVHPSGVSVALAGMVNELNELFPGGFGREGAAPQRYGATDLFSNDPDYQLQSFHRTQTVEAVVDDLVQRHIVPRTHVVAAEPIEPPVPATVDSVTLRGEESVRSLLKDLAVRAGGAAWGIDPWGRFFFRGDHETTVSSYRLEDDVTRCVATRSRDILFNRLQITGDYIYDRADGADNIAQRAYRFRQIHARDTSVTAYGEHRIRLWLPWIRTDADAARFATAFFDLYAAPPTKYLVDAIADAAEPPMPWLGQVQLLDGDGEVVIAGTPTVVRVTFDECPTVRLEIGPDDPRRLWPEPREDERYEIPTIHKDSGTSDFTSSLSSVLSDSSVVDDPPGGSSSGDSGVTSESDWTSLTSTALTSLTSEDLSSATSFDPSSWTSEFESSESSEWGSSLTSDDFTSQTSIDLSSEMTSSNDSSGWSSEASNGWSSEASSAWSSDASGWTSASTSDLAGESSSGESSDGESSSGGGSEWSSGLSSGWQSTSLTSDDDSGRSSSEVALSTESGGSSAGESDSEGSESGGSDSGASSAAESEWPTSWGGESSGASGSGELSSGEHSGVTSGATSGGATSGAGEMSSVGNSSNGWTSSALTSGVGTSGVGTSGVESSDDGSTPNPWTSSTWSTSYT